MNEVGIERYRLGRWVRRQRRKSHGIFKAKIYKKIENVLGAYTIYKALENPHSSYEVSPNASLGSVKPMIEWEPGYYAYFIRWKEKGSW